MMKRIAYSKKKKREDGGTLRGKELRISRRLSAFSKMAAAVLPPLMLLRAISLFLSLSRMHTLSPCHTHSLSLSHAYDTRIRPSPSVLVRVKSLACAQHARAHARHSPKSILYVSRCVRRHSFLLLHLDRHLLLLFLLRLLLTVLAVVVRSVSSPIVSQKNRGRKQRT